jgi:hypothetical protein
VTTAVGSCKSSPATAAVTGKLYLASTTGIKDGLTFSGRVNYEPDSECAKVTKIADWNTSEVARYIVVTSDIGNGEGTKARYFYNRACRANIAAYVCPSPWHLITLAECEGSGGSNCRCFSLIPNGGSVYNGALNETEYKFIGAVGNWVMTGRCNYDSNGNATCHSSGCTQTPAVQGTEIYCIK